MAHLHEQLLHLLDLCLFLAVRLHGPPLTVEKEPKMRLLLRNDFCSRAYAFHYQIGCDQEGVKSDLELNHLINFLKKASHNPSGLIIGSIISRCSKASQHISHLLLKP